MNFERNENEYIDKHASVHFVLEMKARLMRKNHRSWMDAMRNWCLRSMFSKTRSNVVKDAWILNQCGLNVKLNAQYKINVIQKE